MGIWSNVPQVPSSEVYQMTRRDGRRNKDFRWRCRACKRMFTVRTGTVFEETKLPLRVSLYALWRGSSRTGISARQLSQEMEISFQAAQATLCRMRHVLWVDSEMKHTKATGERKGHAKGPEHCLG
jgi:transposase-like protein